jgi:hypothetical protein
MDIANVVVGTWFHRVHENARVWGERNFELLNVFGVQYYFKIWVLKTNIPMGRCNMVYVFSGRHYPIVC